MLECMNNANEIIGRRGLEENCVHEQVRIVIWSYIKPSVRAKHSVL